MTERTVSKQIAAEPRPNGHRRAVLYARVSTDEQAEHGYSLQTQTQEMRDYCARHTLTIAAELPEDYTGTSLDRPQLDRARALLAAGEAEAIIFHTADRMSRKLAHALLLREEFRKLGVEVHTVSRGRSEDTSEARMTENIEAVFAEYWREKLIEGSRRGRRGKAAAGKWVGTGHAPYGWRAVGRDRERHLEIDEAEAAVVRRIFALCLGLEGRPPLTAWKISALLQAEGVPTPDTGRAARGWHDSTVKHILRNPEYIGEFKYGDQIAHIPDLAIVDVLTWNAAQQRKARNRTLARRRAKADYLLSGHLTCRCGQRMGGSGRLGRYFYYACLQPHHRYDLDRCREPYIRRDLADAVVWKWIDGLVRDEPTLLAGLRRMREREAAAVRPNRERLDEVKRLIREGEGEMKKSARDLRKMKNPRARAGLRRELDALGKSLDALQAEQTDLEALLARQTLSQADHDYIVARAREFKAALDEDPDFETKRFFLDRLGFAARLWHDPQGLRWLHVTCGLGEDDLLIKDGSGAMLAA